METDGRQRELCSNIYAERRTSSERERDSRARVGENKGASTETDRGQGAFCAPEAPRENSYM